MSGWETRYKISNHTNKMGMGRGPALKPSKPAHPTLEGGFSAFLAARFGSDSSRFPNDRAPCSKLKGWKEKETETAALSRER